MSRDSKPKPQPNTDPLVLCPCGKFVQRDCDAWNGTGTTIWSGCTKPKE